MFFYSNLNASRPDFFPFFPENFLFPKCKAAFFYIFFENDGTAINTLYTGGLFHCYKLDESICHFKGIGSILSLLFYFLYRKILSANNVVPDQMPHDVTSDLGLQCLPMTPLRVG